MAMTILSILLGSAVASHLFGMRLMGITNAKGSASAEACRHILLLTPEICSSRMVAVGDGNLSSFSEAGMDAPQRGSALQIFPSSDTNAFIRYFLDSSDNRLKRMTNGASIAVVVASGISNSDVFTAEDFSGNVLSNSEDNCAIGLTLQFYQVPGADLSIGPTSFYKSFQVQTKIAQRAL